MGRHELSDEPPVTEPIDRAKVIEIKVVVTAVVALLADVAYAVANAVAERPDILAPWPPAVRFITIAAIPPVLAFLAGYAKRSNRV